MANESIKTTAKESGVHLWEIAEQLKMSDSYFSRKLRRELPENERDLVLAIIAKIKSER